MTKQQDFFLKTCAIQKAIKKANEINDKSVKNVIEQLKEKIKAGAKLPTKKFN